PPRGSGGPRSRGAHDGSRCGDRGPDRFQPRGPAPRGHSAHDSHRHRLARLPRGRGPGRPRPRRRHDRLRHPRGARGRGWSRRRGLPGGGEPMSGQPAASAAATLPIATRRRAFAHLAPHLRGRAGWIVLLVIAGLANAAAGLVGPWAIGRLVDALPAGSGADVVWTSAAAVAAAGIVMAVGTWAGAWALARVTMPAVGDLRTEVVTAALSLEAQRVERTGTGDLVSRVADDSRKVSEGAAQVLPLVVESLLVVVVSAVGLAVVDWRLGLVGLTALPMYWLTLRWYLPRSAP